MNIQIIISVPPEQSRIQYYNLNEIVNYVHFVIVKTHVLVMPDIVACSGERVSSARVFNQVVQTVNFTFRNKFAYSISVAPETFTATSSNLWVRSTGPSKWDNYTLQPGKAHLASVCQQQAAFYSGYTECFFVSQAQSNRTFRVAALTPRVAVRSRIKRSYDDGMGIAPVMVYDIDLDDFEGNCSRDQIQSPLLEQLATASY
ncbi:hypothetical protein HPB50_025248 [Hyalomma asiaticum]|uniref:Uncharacterized protein n=1 Tax=Hyalomma asiaticum TaxID=266040 RepID=A0ACB7SKU8_HYAAI|nr:hypothetical protein HPB50_025248 [Hyalomma asiaticum]